MNRREYKEIGLPPITAPRWCRIRFGLILELGETSWGFYLGLVDYSREWVISLYAGRAWAQPRWRWVLWSIERERDNLLVRAYEALPRGSPSDYDGVS